MYIYRFIHTYSLSFLSSLNLSVATARTRTVHSTRVAPCSLCPSVAQPQSSSASHLPGSTCELATGPRLPELSAVGEDQVRNGPKIHGQSWITGSSCAKTLEKCMNPKASLFKID